MSARAETTFRKLKDFRASFRGEKAVRERAKLEDLAENLPTTTDVCSFIESSTVTEAFEQSCSVLHRSIGSTLQQGSRYMRREAAVPQRSTPRCCSKHDSLEKKVEGFEVVGLMVGLPATLKVDPVPATRKRRKFTAEMTSLIQREFAEEIRTMRPPNKERAAAFSSENSELFVGKSSKDIHVYDKVRNEYRNK